MDVVKQIAGDKVLVQGIIPPDVDPHNFEPSPKDMGPLVHASLWIQVGEEFEYLLENRLKETTPDMVIINLPSITKTLHSSCSHHGHKHCGDSIDTHYWLDPLTVSSQAKAIAGELSLIDPENANFYQENLTKLTKRLEELNAHITKELLPYEGNVFLTTHKAYGYFCHRYRLEQIGIEADDGKEMRTGDIHTVIQKAQEHRNELVGIFTQPQHVNRAAETLGRELDLPLFMVNPYEENYIATIRKLARITHKYGKVLHPTSD